jgi:Spy/CpxP family protein refolding chaperone
MKKVLGGLLLSALFLAIAPCSSYAAACGCPDPGMHEEGMSMPGGMRHQDMDMVKPGHRMWMRRPGYRMWMQLRRLGLDEKQKEAIRDIRSRHMKDAISKMADVRIARIELRDILANDTVDMQAVGAKLKEIASLQTELRLSRIKAMEEVKAQLTPEQRKKLGADMEKYRGPERFGREGRRGMGMEAPDGRGGKMQPDMDHMD